MNEAFFQYAMKRIDELTDEELAQGLIEAGFDVVLRQYPEPEVKRDIRLFIDSCGSMEHPTHESFLEPVQHG